jgi:hypothetical protein
MIVEADSEYQPDDTISVAQKYIDSSLLDNKESDFQIHFL